MSKRFSPDALHGKWLHSHEEDSPGKKVFRPSDHPFPRSRGRVGFELRPGGVFVDIGIAPADGPQERRGSWELEEDIVRVQVPPGVDRSMTILSLDSKRLVIKH